MNARAPVTAWCRMNDCYRTTQTDSDFCAKHGWNQNVEREPQTKHSASEGTVAGNETPVSSTPAAGGTTSRSAQLQQRLREERIGARTSWGLYVELRAELRKRFASETERSIAERRTGRTA